MQNSELEGESINKYDEPVGDKKCRLVQDVDSFDCSDSEVTEASSSLSSSPPDAKDDVIDPTVSLERGAEERNKSHLKRVIKVKSLSERSRLPPGMIVGALLVFSCIFSSGFGLHVFSEIIPGLVRSLTYVNQEIVHRFKTLLFDSISILKGGDGTCAMSQNSCAAFPIFLYFKGGGIACLITSIYYVLLYKPLRAGMWGPTQRATRHVLHRYMGLLFIIQYSYAWFEFIYNYEDFAQYSYLPVTIALNGITQSASAYFSFKVLPDLDDAGYYSDKAVLSRNFVFENSFYQLLSVFGSVFYNDRLRAQMMSCYLGRCTVILFCFFPYVFVRTWFPITRFKDAGTSMAGRSRVNERFYQIGTAMVKFFYLWAKYFLGFFINWYVYLEKVTPTDMKLIRGLFLLNVGTVSISIFLHTLRFKKILPAKITFSIYLAQIYATFSAIPSAYIMFSAHPRLGALTFAGLVSNMTRNRFIHFIWCLFSLYMISSVDLEW